MEFKIKVEDMHCGHCVARIDNALSEVGIKHQINLEEKTVIIDGCEHCLKTAISEIEDLGFTPEINQIP